MKIYTEDNISYLFNSINIKNIGDVLCTPSKYFRLYSKYKVLIIGGGVFKNLGLDFIQGDTSYDYTILWGVGRSVWGKENTLPKIEKLPYSGWGLRDKDCVQAESNFLPCVSCLHNMLDTPREGNETLVFLNANERVTPLESNAKIRNFAQSEGWNILYNNIEEVQIRDVISKSNLIITNSYHGAYWGFLAGKQVAVIGYSTKFISLFSTLGLNPSKLLFYDPSIGDDLSNKIVQVSSNNVVQLCNSIDTKNEFRKKNIIFLNEMISRGIFDEYECKDDCFSFSFWK